MTARLAHGPVRVLHVIQNLNYGGMERLIAEMITHLDRSRFETHVMGLQYLGRFSEGLEGLADFHVGPKMTRLSMLRPTALARSIAAIAPDVVHSHSGVWFKASLAARMAGVPRLVHTDHGRTFPIPAGQRALDRLALGRTDVLVAVSQELADRLAGTDAAYASVITVVANGVDTERNRPRPDSGALRAELGLDERTPIIGSVGRLEPVKGYDVSVAAMAALREEWPDGESPPVLVIAGDGSAMEALRAQSRRAGLERSVHLLSWRDDIADLHSAFTLFTMSSRSEGTSVSLLEAMSAGLCPVVTDVGGNAAVLGDRLGHRLVPADDPRALAAAWRDALLDAEGRARDAALARERVCRSFGLDDMVRRYAEIYLGDGAVGLRGRSA